MRMCSECYAGINNPEGDSNNEKRRRMHLGKKQICIAVPVIIVVAAALIVGGYFLIRHLIFSPYNRLKTAWNNTINAESMHAETKLNIKTDNQTAKLTGSVDRVNTKDENALVSETETEINNFEIGNYDAGKILDFISGYFDMKKHTIIFNNTDRGLYISYCNSDISTVETVYTDKKLSETTKNADISDLGLLFLGILNEQLGKDGEKFTDYAEDKDALYAAIKDVISAKNLSRYSEISVNGNEYNINVDIYKLTVFTATKIEPLIKAEHMQDFEELKTKTEGIKEKNPTLDISLLVEDEYVTEIDCSLQTDNYELTLSAVLSDFGNVNITIPDAVTASYSRAKRIESVYEYLTKKLLPWLSTLKKFMD